MFTRLALGTASVLALAVASAAPAGAQATEGPDFPAGAAFVCDAPADDGAPWRPWVSVTSDGTDGFSTADYSLRPDARSTFAMPIGGGDIQAVSYQESIDGEIIFSSDRPEVPAEERNACDYPFPSGAITIRGEVRYLNPPVRPSFVEVAGFCLENAGNEDYTEYERTTCLQVLTAEAGVTPETK